MLKNWLLHKYSKNFLGYLHSFVA